NRRPQHVHSSASTPGMFEEEWKQTKRPTVKKVCQKEGAQQIGMGAAFTAEGKLLEGSAHPCEILPDRGGEKTTRPAAGGTGDAACLDVEAYRLRVQERTTTAYAGIHLRLESEHRGEVPECGQGRGRGIIRAGRERVEGLNGKLVELGLGL